MSEQEMAEKSRQRDAKVADVLYTTYCGAVGGVNFQGDPLPDWKTFSSDPTKKKQSDAWLAVAAAASDFIDY